MITWDACQWLQYIGFEWNKSNDTISFKFKTSSYGIGFDVEVKAFSDMYGEPDINYREAYSFFREIKYSEYER